MPEDGFPGGKLADNEERLQGCYPCLWQGRTRQGFALVMSDVKERGILLGTNKKPGRGQNDRIRKPYLRDTSRLFPRKLLWFMQEHVGRRRDIFRICSCMLCHFSLELISMLTV